MLNEAFGWAWITLGFLSGAVLGMFFNKPDFLGGYAAYPRRLVRLGHISLFGLGILNILFALSAPHARCNAGDLRIASWSMVAGGVTMPLCCGLVAWRPALKWLFAVPVASLLLGGWTLAFGLVRQAMGANP